MPDFLLTKQKGKDYLDLELLVDEERFKSNLDDEEQYVENLIDLSLTTNLNARDVLNPIFNVGSVLELFASIENFKSIGSTIWADSNRELSNITLSEIESKANEALNWLLENQILKSIYVIARKKENARVISVAYELRNNIKKDLKYSYYDYKFTRKV
jgi:phage gp46-like protein